MLWRSAAVAGMLSVCACGDGRVDVGAQPSASASTSASGVYVSADGVFLDGKRIEGRPSISELLSARHAAWKEEPRDPMQPFPGVIEVELAPETACKPALSVMRECADGHFPNVSLEVGDRRSRIGVDPDGFFEPASPRPHLWFRTDGSVEVRKHGCFPAYATVRPEQVVPTMKKLFPTSKLRAVLVSCDPNLPFASIAGYFAEDSAGWPAGLDGQLTIAPGVDCQHDPLLTPVDPAKAEASLTMKVVEDDASLGKSLEHALEKLRPTLLGCHFPTSTKHPGAREKVKIAVLIGDTGVVVDREVLESEVRPPVRMCLEHEVLALRVDDPVPPKFAHVTLALEFVEKR